MGSPCVQGRVGIVAQVAQESPQGDPGVAQGPREALTLGEEVLAVGVALEGGEGSLLAVGIDADVGAQAAARRGRAVQGAGLAHPVDEVEFGAAARRVLVAPVGDAGTGLALQLRGARGQLFDIDSGLLQGFGQAGGQGDGFGDV